MNLGYNAAGGTANLWLLQKTDGTYLSYTAIGSWAGAWDDKTDSEFVAGFIYGAPTAAAAMPKAGLSDYVVAYSPESKLKVDFVAGTVSGQIGEQGAGGNGALLLQGVSITADGNRFTGSITDAAGKVLGEIEGYFTGPAAEEMMARLTVGTQITDTQVLPVRVFGAVRR